MILYCLFWKILYNYRFKKYKNKTYKKTVYFFKNTKILKDIIYKNLNLKYGENYILIYKRQL